MTTKSLLHSSLLDNQYYTSMLVGNDAYDPTPPGSYDLLQTAVVTNSTSPRVTLTNINSTYGADYDHLQLRVSSFVVHTPSGDAGFLDLEFNGVTQNSNYFGHSFGLRRNTTPVDQDYSTSSRMYAAVTALDNGTDVKGYSIIDIWDAFSTNKSPTYQAFGGMRNTNEYDMVVFSGGYDSPSAAIDSISIHYPDNTLNLRAGTRVSLYGLKATV